MSFKYTDSNTIKTIFNIYPDLIEIKSDNNKHYSIEVNEYIYLSCSINTNTPRDYFVIYEPNEVGKSSLKGKNTALSEDDYWSAYNKGFFAKKTDKPNFVTYCDNDADADIIHVGTGDALVIINAKTLDILNIFYFKDTYNMPCPIEIVDVVCDKVVVKYCDYNYVFYKENYDFLTFVFSDRHNIFGYLWINHPFCGYDAGCGWCYIDFKTKKESLIHALYNKKIPMLELVVENLTNCEYDYRASKFLFFSKDECISFDFKVLCADESEVSLLRYTDIGTHKCRYEVSFDQEIQTKEIQVAMVNRVSSWENIKEIPYCFFWYYYPTRFECVSKESERARRIVWNFKDGKSSIVSVADIVIQKLSNTFSYTMLEHITFVCIPASSSLQNKKRYKIFSSDVCDAVCMKNAYSHIKIIKEKKPAHLSPTHKEEPAEYYFDKEFFKNSNIVLFDDIITTGRSLIYFKKQLELLGANVICAISISRTYSDYDGDKRKPHPYTGIL